MWFSATLWTILASLVCSTVAYSSRHSSYPDYETDHRTSSRTYSSDPRWNALEGYEKDPQGKILDLNSWPSETDTLSRQLFSADTDEPLLMNLDEADLPKNKREGHSLSIVNPLDVLRQRLMLEMARRRMKENENQIRENAVILKNLGKRSITANSANNKGDLDARTKQDYLRRIHVSNSENFEG